ncbi:MAG: hypothetical protein WCJ64_25870 [Rhodospirillaceae bacterium]
MSDDRLLTAIMDANARVPDVTFLGLIGRPAQPITICMCADYLIPLTLYQGDEVEEALKALTSAVNSLETAGPA